MNMSRAGSFQPCSTVSAHCKRMCRHGTSRNSTMRKTWSPSRRRHKGHTRAADLRSSGSMSATHTRTCFKGLMVAKQYISQLSLILVCHVLGDAKPNTIQAQKMTDIVDNNETPRHARNRHPYYAWYGIGVRMSSFMFEHDATEGLST
jgi:hypothetical protein